MEESRKIKRAARSPNVSQNRYVCIRSAAESLNVRNSGYSEGGASTTRRAFKGMTATSGSPETDILLNIQLLRERSRLMYQNAPPVTSAIKTYCTNVIGTGLKPKPTIDAAVLGMTEEQAREFERKILAEFRLWASDPKSCDALGMNTFDEQQNLAMNAWAQSGDAFTLIQREKRTRMRPYSLRLRLIEADRVRVPAQNSMTFSVEGMADNGNRIFDGVEVNARGAVEAYYIASGYPHEYSPQPMTYKRVEAYGARTGLPNILPLMVAERPDQYRGVPLLSNVVEELLQLRRYTEGELAAAVIQSFWTAFITTETDPTEMPFNEAIPEDEPGGGVSNDENEYELGPGTVNHLKLGEKVIFGQPTHPQAGFDVFQGAISEQIGAALGMSRDLLLKKFGESYSASRAELLEAWKTFATVREWFINDFCRPIYKIWFYEAVATGRITAPGFFDDPIIQAAYLGCDWIGPSAGQINPVDEIKASILAINAGLSTHEIEAARLNGSDFATNIQKLKTENERLREAGASLNVRDIMDVQSSMTGEEAQTEKEANGDE